MHPLWGTPSTLALLLSSPRLHRKLTWITLRSCPPRSRPAFFGGLTHFTLGPSCTQAAKVSSCIHPPRGTRCWLCHCTLGYQGPAFFGRLTHSTLGPTCTYKLPRTSQLMHPPLGPLWGTQSTLVLLLSSPRLHRKLTWIAFHSWLNTQAAKVISAHASSVGDTLLAVPLHCAAGLYAEAVGVLQVCINARNGKRAHCCVVSH